MKIEVNLNTHRYNREVQLARLREIKEDAKRAIATLEASLLEPDPPTRAERMAAKRAARAAEKDTKRAERAAFLAAVKERVKDTQAAIRAAGPKYPAWANTEALQAQVRRQWRLREADAARSSTLRAKRSTVAKAAPEEDTRPA